MQPYFNPGPSDAVTPPIWLGAVNAAMCELAGEVAHGVVTHSTNSDPAYLRDVVRPALHRGAASAGRTTEPLLMASAAIATGDSDAAVSRERERQRRMLAFLYSTPAYSTALKRRGWIDLPDRLRALVRAQRWDDLPTVLSDAVLDELVICGRYDELPGMLMARFGQVADGVVLPALGDENDEGMLEACIAELQARALTVVDRGRGRVGEEPRQKPVELVQLGGRPAGKRTLQVAPPHVLQRSRDSLAVRRRRHE